MTGLSEIRSAFLKYFADNAHTVVASSPLVPRNDPTLMFTNSGMVQFKNVFTGIEKRDYSRAVTSQKCVRAGGKHNDLDNVGYTARHHTFFEMLGNFSFGDYFKEAAIAYCWDFVTRELGVEPDRLLATVYHEDDEAAAHWKKIAGLTDSRIIRISTADNFWTMGPVGPCGPCSELFYDYGDDVPGGPPGSADDDGDRFTEIWNLVFMQYEQHQDGRCELLPKPSVDTGMGLERIGALLQGVRDNYRTDLIRSLIEAVANATSTDPDGPDGVHHRVIADHLRSTAFLIAEGVMPTKDGRGYVLRRIMRRAMRHAFLLGAKDPVMHRLVPELVSQMGSAFPELVQARSTIEYTLHDEETRFRRTLGRGLGLLDAELQRLPEGAALPGETAFKLYDTFGFPLDLTQDAVRETGRSVDAAAFDAAMEEQRRRARAAFGGIGEAAEDVKWFELAETVGTTEFLGYETEQAEGQILAILRDGTAVEHAGSGEAVQVIVNQTPFYAEAGGQVGDTGHLVTDGGRAEITDTHRRAGVIVHEATVIEGKITRTPSLLKVDGGRRQKTRMNHSATHLLHEALRSALGSHVAQRGSRNDASRLRFDFSHFGALTLDELSAVEREVNAFIRENSPVLTRIMTPEDATKVGALALFGEKYGDEVRVVSMGHRKNSGKGPEGSSYSVELCGGTHVDTTGAIGLFVTTGESASAAGIRRIEALTGEKAFEYLAGQDQTLAEISLLLKAPPPELLGRIKALLSERRTLQSEVERLRREIAIGSGSNTGATVDRTVNGIRFVAQSLTGVPGKELPALIDSHKENIGSGIVAIAAASDGKSAVAVGVTNDLVARFSAVDIVRCMTPAIGGSGGGGRPDLARGGGPETEGCADALSAAENYVQGV